MGDGIGGASEVFERVQEHVTQGLHAMGQDSELAQVVAMLFLALVGLALLWGVLLVIVRAVLALFGGGAPEVSSRREEALSFGARGDEDRRDPARLDIPATRAAAEEEEWVPNHRTKPLSQAAGRTRQNVRAEAPSAGPSVVGNAAETTVARSAERPAERFTGPFLQIKMASLPNPVERGSVVSARPEWTGRVVPSSFQEAGAVEVCRVLTRRTPAIAASADTVRAVDYRVCGMPRVDGEGRRRPDVLVYTVADRGFLPKAATPKLRRS